MNEKFPEKTISFVVVFAMPTIQTTKIYFGTKVFSFVSRKLFKIIEEMIIRPNNAPEQLVSDIHS